MSRRFVRVYFMNTILCAPIKKKSFTYGEKNELNHCSKNLLFLRIALEVATSKDYTKEINRKKLNQL